MFLTCLRKFSPASLLLFALGCAAPSKQAVLEPINPPPPNVSESENKGYLLVYSAWSNFVDVGSTGHHSRYTVSSDDGKWSREIINHVDRFDEGPIQLALQPGAYHVRTRSARFGRLSIPVIIQANQTSVIYVDGRPHAPVLGTQQTSAVKLPNGEIVGWAATFANRNPH